MFMQQPCRTTSPIQTGDSDDEFVNYLSRLQHSADGLADFLERLSQIDEPTIVLFVGDHFPSLRGDDGIYSQLNITSENCSTLYEQRYILWNNYGLDTSSLPHGGGFCLLCTVSGHGSDRCAERQLYPVHDERDGGRAGIFH